MNEMEKCRIRTKNDSAVSEAIGFTLIFSLVMIGIGLITLYGYPVLLETQSNANVRNMERDMIVLQNDLKSLVYKNVPYKETSLQVSGGALGVYDRTTTKSTFQVSYSNGNVAIPSHSCGQLRYESDAGESIIALENGAVLTRMEFQEGSVMLSEPRWFIDEVDTGNGIINKTFIITFINVTSDEPMSRNGIGIVRMKLETSEVLPPINDPAGMKVEVTYTPNDSKLNFSKGWENYFVYSLKMTPKSGSPNTYETDDDINNLVIKKYNIKILSI
jgi:hypothetical protein